MFPPAARRGALPAGDELPAAKRPRYLSARCQLRLLVPGESVASLIGSGGSMIKYMESACGATISFDKEDQMILGEALRLVTLYGDTMEVNTEGLSVILVTMSNTRPHEQSTQQHTVKMLVPNHLVAMLIGAKGTAVKTVAAETGAYISFCKETDMPPGSAFRAITLSGELGQVCSAQHRLTESHEQLLQREVGTPAAPPPQASSAFWGVDVADYAPADRSGGLRPPPHPATALQTWRPSSPPAPVANGLSSMTQLTLTMWIPNEKVSLFIGGRGAHIKRITESTNAYVSVQKEDANTYVNGQTMRPVLMEGPLEAVLEAQKMAMRAMFEIDPGLSFSVTAAFPGLA